MKATIEFDLPADQDAHLDAIQGAKWKQLVFDLETWLRMRISTEENLEPQRVFGEVNHFLLQAKETAGLTFCGAEALLEESKKHLDSCTEKIKAYMREQGYQRIQ